MSSAPVTSPSIRPEDERLPVGKAFLYGFQHILSMYGGVIAVPLIVGTAAKLPPEQVGMLVAAALFVSGLSTLLQSLGLPFLGSKLPLVNGTTFGAVSTMLAILASGGGLPVIFGSVMVAGVIGFLLAPLFSKIQRFFPPVVTGTIITAMGISLLPVAAGWITGQDPGGASLTNLALAAFTLAVVLVCTRVRQLARVAILVGILVGTVVAAVTGQADFSQVLHGAVFAFPQPFFFGAPRFEVGAIISMTIVIIVTLMEIMADLFAVAKVVGTDVDEKRIADGLRADMLATIVAPLFNSTPPTAFAQNVGLVAVTKVKSRYTVAAGAVLLLLLGMFPLLGRVVACVPSAVLGGAGVVLFGSVAAAGIQTLQQADFERGNNIFVVATSLALVMFPIAAPSFYAHVPTWLGMILGSGISAAALSAVVLNLLLNGRHATRGSLGDEMEAVPAPEPFEG
ncbi:MULTISPECIES: uracil-xanthine permease family protein [unclassified Luteococcus]|uniref:uracil-xanthine permease family protein n=1 Tax=unclassified Luteococcus TaxID=2639923 RepID=UPI00313AF73A